MSLRVRASQSMDLNIKNMNGQSQCFVSGALATILRLSRFAGVAPLRFKKKGNGWRISLFPSVVLLGNTIVTIFCIINFGALTAMALGVTGRHSETQHSMRVLVFHIKLLVTTVLGAMLVYSAPGKMRNLIVCLNQIQKINSTLYVYHWPSKWTRNLIKLFFIWGTVTVLTVVADHIFAFNSFLVEAEGLLKMKFILTNVSYCAMQLQLMQYVLLVIHVRSGFKAVNSLLTSVLNDLQIKHDSELGTQNIRLAKNSFRRINNFVNISTVSKELNSVAIKQSERQHEWVRRAATAYAAACDVMRSVDHSQGFLVLMMMFYLFLHLIGSAYNVIGHFNLDQDDITGRKIHIAFEFIHFLWCIVNTFNMVMIIEPCHLTHDEMEITRDLVSQVLQVTDSAYDQVTAELEQFRRQLVVNHVSYKAYKLITLTRLLLLNIFSYITSYLVIIVGIK